MAAAKFPLAKIAERCELPKLSIKKLCHLRSHEAQSLFVIVPWIKYIIHTLAPQVCCCFVLSFFFAGCSWEPILTPDELLLLNIKRLKRLMWKLRGAVQVKSGALAEKCYTPYMVRLLIPSPDLLEHLVYAWPIHPDVHVKSASVQSIPEKQQKHWLLHTKLFLSVRYFYTKYLHILQFFNSSTRLLLAQLLRTCKTASSGRVIYVNSKFYYLLELLLQFLFGIESSITPLASATNL